MRDGYPGYQSSSQIIPEIKLQNVPSQSLITPINRPGGGAAVRPGGGLTIFLTEEHGTLATVCLIILARSAVVEMII